MIEGYSDKSACDMRPEHTGTDLFGIELEVEARRLGSGRTYREDRESRERAYNWLRQVHGFRHADEYVVCKSDSSLNRRGFEVVTRPDGAAQHKRRWDTFFANAPQTQLTSWVGGRCGMHVHVNRAALTTGQVAKMLVFINSPQNRSLLESIAGRYHRSYCRYRHQRLTDVFRGNCERNVALNLCNEHTVEFRIFRGTVVRDGFFKNLEFVQAVVEFCRMTDRSFDDSKNGTKFVEFIRSHRKAYPTLFAYLVTKNFLPPLPPRKPQHND